jgi:hypothetical protein
MINVLIFSNLCQKNVSRQVNRFEFEGGHMLDKHTVTTTQIYENVFVKNIIFYVKQNLITKRKDFCQPFCVLYV